MELFLPSILAFLIAAGFTFAVIPKLSPMIIAILSIVLLILATYHHFSLFSSEYKLSTWQDILKSYAPGVFIIVLIIFIIIAILGFFGGPSVPVPSLPTIANLPPANTSTNLFTETINNGLRSNIGNTITNTVGNAFDTITNGVKQVTDGTNNITRSMLATI